MSNAEYLAMKQQRSVARSSRDIVAANVMQVIRASEQLEMELQDEGLPTYAERRVLPPELQSLPRDKVFVYSG